MKNVFFILFYLIYFICNGRSQEEETEKDCKCKLDIDGLMAIHNYPLYIRKLEEGILYPKYNSNTIELETGETMEAHCTGYAGLFIEMEHYHSRYLILRCLYDWMFETKDRKIDIRNLRCAERVDSVAQLTQTNCGANGKKIRIGYEISLGFVLQYTVCFNFQLQTTEYSHSQIQPLQTWTRQTRAKKRYNAHFFSVPDRIYRLYMYPRVVDTINAQIGRNNSLWMEADRYPFKIVIRRFDLSSSGDWFWEYEKTATQFYVNIVPHFSSIPWYIVKMIIRFYASRKKLNVDLYTGTYGILKLLHVNGTYVPIFLEANLQQVPIPNIFYKVAYDKTNNAGIAFVAVNNYFARGNYTPLCNDISWDLPWMNDFIHQYVYICRIEDWYKVVNTSFPRFEATSIIGQDLKIPRDYFDIRKQKKSSQRVNYDDDNW